MSTVVFQQDRVQHAAWAELLNTSESISQGTYSFCIKPITPAHTIPQISTPLIKFCGCT